LISTATVARVPAQQVDRADVGGVLAAHEAHAFRDDPRVRGQQLLQVGFDAVLLQARVLAELVRAVGDHLADRDREDLALGVGDLPDRDDTLRFGRVVDGEPVRCVHPVQWLVGPAVGVDRHAPVGFHHDQADGLGQVSGEPPVVVDGAPGDDETHGAGTYRRR
jgi:hypothetical protein